MEPEQDRTLRLVRDGDPNFRRMFSCVWSYIFLALVPVGVAVLCNPQEAVADRGTQALIHDVQARESLARSYPSAWRDSDMIRNLPSYAPMLVGCEVSLTLYVLFFNWQAHALLLINLTASLFKLICCYLVFLEERFGWRNVTIYVLVCSLLTMITLIGIYNVLWSVAGLLRDNVIKWFDQRIHVVALPSQCDQFEFSFPHGFHWPRYLFTFFRHYKEDVVFKCEFVVNSYTEAQPVYKTSGWRKGGIPVVPGDKIDVKTRITRRNHTNGKPELGQFSVVTTLTIKLIEDEDFGSYTCDFYNPMEILVRPGSTMFQDYTVKGDTSAPPPVPKGSRWPPPPFATDQTNWTQNHQTRDQADPAWLTRNSFIRYAEFHLIPYPQYTLELRLLPGSILIDSTFYRTVSDAEDIEYDVTSYSADSPDHNCCSQLVRMYWLLTRTRCFTTFPDSRLLHFEGGFMFERAQCLCLSSFGTRDFVVYRNFYKSSLGAVEKVSINSPMRLRLIPELSHPFSQTNQSTNQSWQDTDCWNTEQASPTCQLQNDLVGQAIDLWLFCENLFLGFCVFLMICAIPLAWLFHQYCIKPCVAACLHYGREKRWFTAVEGPPLEIIQSYQAGRPPLAETSPHYGFYLSYDEDDPYDLRLSQFLKDWLETRGFPVYDPRTDILPGQFQMAEMEQAIPRCDRFIVIMSAAYSDNDMKALEFDAIQSTVINQGSQLPERLFLFRIGHCRIRGLCRVASLDLPLGLRENHAIDDHSVLTFQNWEQQTQPMAERPPSWGQNYTVVRQLLTFPHLLRVSCFFILTCFTLCPNVPQRVI